MTPSLLIGEIGESVKRTSRREPPRPALPVCFRGFGRPSAGSLAPWLARRNGPAAPTARPAASGLRDSGGRGMLKNPVPSMETRIPLASRIERASRIFHGLLGVVRPPDVADLGPVEIVFLQEVPVRELTPVIIGCHRAEMRGECDIAALRLSQARFSCDPRQSGIPGAQSARRRQ